MLQCFRTMILGKTDEKLFETSRVVRVTSVEHWEDLLEEAKLSIRPVVVDFAASRCARCRYIAPFFHELSTQHPSTLFLKVDMDELKVVGSACGVTELPTFQFFKGDIQVDEISSVVKKKLEILVKKYDVPAEVADPGREMWKIAMAPVKLLVEVVEVKSATAWAELKQQSKDSGNPLVVNFWAPWCSPCVMITPFFKALSAKHYGSVLFAKVDVSRLEDVRGAENVNAMPTFKIFKNGECVETMEGAIRSALEVMVARHA